MNKPQTKVGQTAELKRNYEMKSLKKWTVLHLSPSRKLSDETFVQFWCSRGYVKSVTVNLICDTI